MTVIQFLAEWALRSSILILCGAILLRALRVKDSSVRLAAWTVMLCGSLAMPLLTAALPDMPLAAIRVVARPPEAPLTARRPALPPAVGEVSSQSAGAAERFDWARAAVMIYISIAGALLVRLLIGLAMTRRLLHSSCETGRVTEGIQVRESDRVAAPVTLGIVRSAIVLPSDWRQWDGTKLDAVLAHERSHIRRKDPAVQLLSAFHRAVLWYSPLSWLLHRSIVRLAEDASDDAAVAATRDRASYAEVLLEFMQRGVRGAGLQGVSMARYGSPEKRIHRILDATALSGGVTRWSLALILAVGLPLAYLAAASHPQRAPQAPKATATAAAPSQAAPPQSGAIRRYMIFLGDSRSGSWDSHDPVDDEALRAKYGPRFAWFRQAGNEYVVTDAGVLADLERAMEPQNKVNRLQSDVNERQSAVNEMQSKVNSQQNEVNALQEEANRRQELVNRIQAAAGREEKEALIQKLEEAIRELRAAKGGGDQEGVNRRQAVVNEAQARVNEAQGKVNAQQHEVNEEQQRVSAEYTRRIQAIFDSAVRRNLAQRLK